MTQKFYLRSSTTTDAPTNGEKSTVQPASTLGANNASGSGQENLLLSGTKGGGETSLAFASDASASARSNYLGRWTSPQLQAGTYGSGTWNINIALSEQNANANSFLNVSIYFIAAGGSSVRGFVYDSSTDIGAEWGTTEDGIATTVTGSNVTASAGDVLVLEVWRHATQAMATAYTQTVYFNGTTDVVDATTTDAASYIQAPADIPEIVTNVTLGNMFGYGLSGTV